MDFDLSSSSAVDLDAHAEFKNRSTILKTPDNAPTTDYPCRQNHVTTVVLHGIAIVCLRIDGKERLCLAQISNTLLKQFSYNEIHNRRVALGITCVQCTPVQLEILRRAGAMPISSRRCGMITKREAERLVKSFLEDNRPPKLPDNFCFEVFHNCGWGCKGKFEPSRYNSSRAKCIRCNFCNLYFSPNKFIFHFHRAPESKYNHPDAANFNSWRRHLLLCPGSDKEDIAHVWEDVKAMFNGGSRKRVMTSPGFPEEHSPMPTTEPKRPKTVIDEELITKPSYPNQFQNYPLFSMPGKSNYPFNQIATTNPLAFHYQLGKTDFTDEAKPAHSLTYNPWRQTTDFIIPPYDILWASQFNHRTSNLAGFRQHYLNSSPVKDITSTDNSLRHSPSETHSSSASDDDTSFNIPIDRAQKPPINRPSAFRPVGKCFPESEITNKEAHTPDTNDNTDDVIDDVNNDIDSIEDNEVDEIEDLDIDVEEEIEEKGSSDICESDINLTDDTSNINTSTDISTENTNIPGQTKVYLKDTKGNNILLDGQQDELNKESAVKIQHEALSTNPNRHLAEIVENIHQHVQHDLQSNNNTAACNLNDKSQYNIEDLNSMSKEELQRLLRNEIDVRKQVEGDINKIKQGLEEQVNNEKSQRDQISKQLQIMKDALCNELEQERKTRLAMQQKLKEAHDALHNFSSKMFTNKPCGDCSGTETVRQ